MICRTNFHLIACTDFGSLWGWITEIQNHHVISVRKKKIIIMLFTRMSISLTVSTWVNNCSSGLMPWQENLNFHYHFISYTAEYTDQLYLLQSALLFVALWIAHGLLITKSASNMIFLSDESCLLNC